jgi:hypothetical protein
VAESLHGSLLPTDARQRLMRLARTMNLSPFDASLVIAIVQDQARRGHDPAVCPRMAEPQLRMVPGPALGSGRVRWTHVVAATAALLTAQGLLLTWLW